MNNDKDLFRQALQRQNERAARMKMSDDMEQRVMERIRSKKVNRRWLYTAIAAVSASILLLLVFRFNQESVEQQPVVAKTIEQSIPQPVPQPIVEEKKEEVLAEMQLAPQPVKKQRKAVKKQSTPVEPVQIESEPMLIEEPIPSYTPTIQDPFLFAAEFAQEIRSHGERLDREIAQMMIK